MLKTMKKPNYLGERYKADANPELVELVESGYWHSMSYEQTLEAYERFESTATKNDARYMAAVDRYFLFVGIMGRRDGAHPWLFSRCREVELVPDGHLDLWARDHYKSTLITLCGAIQEILNNPEITIGIFSHTKPIARAFIRQIKRELETNESFVELWPDIFYPKKSQYALWSDNGIIVQRQTNPKEATIEAHGLVDGQPTSKHFMLLIYDDVVTRESVTTPDQIRKTTEAWELSDNLGSKDDRRWYIGTRYSFADTYGEMMNRNIVTPRLYPATEDGTPEGKPVFLSEEKWEAKKRTQRSTLAAQMLQNPIAGKERMFKPEWLRSYEIRAGVMNIYITGDPSKGASNRSDRTAIAVIGIDANNNKYLLDGYCHRMNMADRWQCLYNLHKKWSRAPGTNLLKVGWERFGQQTDDEYFREKMDELNYFFEIEELAWPRDNTYSKQDRVERLQPDMQYSRFFLPCFVHEPHQGDCNWMYNFDEQRLTFEKKKGDSKIMRLARERGQAYLCAKPIKRVDENGETYDVTRKFMDELLFFPFSPHDDFCDAASRIYDLEPMAAKFDKFEPEYSYED